MNLPSDGVPETTGRYIIVYDDSVLTSPNDVNQSLNRVAGIKNVASAADFDSAVIDPQEASDAEALYFPALGIAVVTADDARLQSVTSASTDRNSNILAIEPEYVYRATSDNVALFDYLRGYRDAVNHLYEELVSKTESEALLGAAVTFQDTAQYTWGLQATQVNSSQYSGQGIKVAILDTGFDLQHPDFVGRSVKSQSFIPGQSVQDMNGHGTHCTGTACGPLQPATGVRRYGCAYGADIFIGKVLSNGGSSIGSSVLNGMNWAVTMQCEVISMSLSAPVNQVSLAFETIGKRALNAGCMIVAAAGNSANRAAGNFSFVEQPANSPSIMAIAAVDNRLSVANFSTRSNAATGNGGRINLAAPGVNVFSSFPTNRGLHGTISGTSMATPHVAGIAALYAQSTGLKGMALWTAVTQNALPLQASSADVGNGLVKAP